MVQEAHLKSPLCTRFALIQAAQLALLAALLSSAFALHAQTAYSPAANAAPAQPSPANARGATVPAINGVELKATINGQGPFEAIFDSGSGNLITSSLVKRLGLKLEGTVTMLAAGGASAPARTVKVDTVNIGSLTMADQWFTVVELPFAKDQQGILVGAQLIQNLPIRVDFEKQQITFYDQNGFTYSGDGVPVPLRFEDVFFVAEGSVDGIPGLFGIDTGDMYSLSLYAPFVTQHGLVRHYGAAIRGYTGEGFGGADIGFYARANTLQIGPMSVPRPITVLSQDSQGAEASSTIAGNIGLRILKQFNLVFDYPHGKLYLEKNANYGKPDIFNRAGLVLDPDPQNLKVKLVVPGSPAAKAGLSVDDVITRIDGLPPDDDTLQSAFTRPVGTPLRLDVRHRGTTRSVSLILQEIL
jgi:predicted aspartyl protease